MSSTRKSVLVIRWLLWVLGGMYLIFGVYGLRGYFYQLLQSDSVEIESREITIPEAKYYSRTGSGLQIRDSLTNQNLYTVAIDDLSDESLKRFRALCTDPFNYFNEGSVLGCRYYEVQFVVDLSKDGGKTGTAQIFLFVESGVRLNYRGKVSEKYDLLAEFVHLNGHLLELDFDNKADKGIAENNSGDTHSPEGEVFNSP